MVFVEFVSKNYPTKGARHYFVGTNLEAILEDTKAGTEFGFAKFSSHQELDETKIHALNVPSLKQGIEKFKDGALKSVYIGFRKR
ncbi:MAG TPA: hypothetical protein PK295_04315 [Candidatus Magasanikbacteria bacterium]|nr:hypothetical protein [Candidatus Magasanikbacteria bacterium]